MDVFYIYTYLGLGSYRLTIIEKNGGVGCKGNSRVVEKSSSHVANMNSECFLVIVSPICWKVWIVGVGAE